MSRVVRIVLKCHRELPFRFTAQYRALQSERVNAFLARTENLTKNLSHQGQNCLRPCSTKYPPKFGRNRLEIKWQKKVLEIMMANHCYHE